MLGGSSPIPAKAMSISPIAKLLFSFSLKEIEGADIPCLAEYLFDVSKDRNHLTLRGKDEVTRTIAPGSVSLSSRILPDLWH
jgi:hypothetical protein